MPNITINHAITYTNSIKIKLNSENASLCNILLLAGTWRVKQVLSIRWMAKSVDRMRDE